MAILIRRPRRKRPKKDETFNAMDIIRLFALNLTKEEKKQVIGFFWLVLPFIIAIDIVLDALYAFRPGKRTAMRIIKRFFLVQRKADPNIIRWIHLIFPFADLPVWTKIVIVLRKDFD